MSEKKKLTRWDLNRAYLLWYFFSHGCYSYERLQGLGFCHTMIPIINRLYTNLEDRILALKRHLVFFNTQPAVGSVIHGLVASMEESRANGAEIDDAAINGVKTSLMGPLAGVGDAIYQGLFTVIFASIGISLAAEGNVMGPVLFIALQFLVNWFGGYYMFMYGYQFGLGMFENILAGSGILRRLTEAAGIVGMMVVGALSARHVALKFALKFKIGQTAIELQPILDRIMPALLPLVLVLVTWKLLEKRSPTKVIAYLAVIGVVGSFLKIL
jgi:mannose/fructose/N-acetylgalactosamine-specific phosphotransferase system component IID